MIQRETTARLLRVAKKDIAYLRHIFEGYEGMANATTVDEQQGILLLQVAPDFLEPTEELLQALRDDIDLHIVEPHIELKG